MLTHNAIAITKPHTIDMIQVSTPSPGENEVLVHVEYASMMALDSYMSDMGFFVEKYPVIPGFNASGTVAKLGMGVVDLSVGDRIPNSISLAEAATLPDNLITSFYTLFSVLDLSIPPSFPARTAPPTASIPILIYGAGSTSGQYMIQLLRAAGYTKILATASQKHHEYLTAIGASAVFDYRDPAKLTAEVAQFVGGDSDGKVPLAVDCISAQSSMSALSGIVSTTGTIAFLLPVKKSNSLTVQHASDMAFALPEDNAPFSPSVTRLGVMAFKYREDPFLKDNLSSKIIPSLLETGIVTPNRVRLIDQGTFTERVEQGLNLLRNNKISGEKVVVK
ncbi:hypothetical protein H0H92_003704, partial [Tricholoma furcatifolium]